MVAGFGILFSGMFVLTRFVLWDRKTTIALAVREIEKLKQIEEVFKVYTKRI